MNWSIRKMGPRSAAETHAAVGYRFWEHRRPKHLLTSVVVCGAYGALFATRWKDYLCCRAAKQGACHNIRLVRRNKLEAHVLDVLGRQLMAPDVAAAFVTTFTHQSVI
jgi:site-specific DNA recombinase